MEVVMPIAPTIPAYPSAPSSPRMAAGDLPGIYYYYASAPTSPSRMNFSFDWEEKQPGDAAVAGDTEAFDFSLGFGGPSKETASILASADELFEGGRIRPLNTNSSDSNLHDQKMPQSVALSSRRGGREETVLEGVGRERGRDFASLSAAPSKNRRVSRSLSPLRGGGGGGFADFDEVFVPSSPPSPRVSIMGGCGSKKWSLKDLLLFRSASEGDASRRSKDPLLKYTLLSSSSSSSFSQSSSKLKNGDNNNGSMRKGRGSTASANDMPYVASRAAAEEMKKRTPLPFHRNSLFGYFRSNPAIHCISRKLSSYAANRNKSS